VQNESRIFFFYKSIYHNNSPSTIELDTFAATFSLIQGRKISQVPIRVFSRIIVFLFGEKDTLARNPEPFLFLRRYFKSGTHKSISASHPL